MKTHKRLFNVWVFLLTGMLFSPGLSAEQSLDSFLSQVKLSLETQNMPAYLSALAPDLWNQEKIMLLSIREDLGFDGISVFKSRGQSQQGNRARAYFQVLFENSYSVYIEVWRLDIQKRDHGWQIIKKSVTGDVSNLYKLKIPSHKMERVDSIEIQHMDISLSFKDALVFYDNIPEFETAILVLGKGDITFSPSSEREQHQLDLVFRKNVLEDELNYAYLRFSNSYFLKNIKIKRSQKSLDPVSETDQKRAYSLFSRHYPRSYTIKNSLTGRLLSSLPQGDEAVIEFRGKRYGIFTYIYSPYAEEEVSLFQWKGKRILNIYSPSLEKEGKRLFIQMGARYDIRHYKIDIEFDPRKKHISGRALIDVRSGTGALTRLKLKLNPSLEILRVSNSEKNSLFYTRDDLRNNLYVYFLQPLGRNENKTIEIFYRGRLNPPDVMADVMTAARIRQDSISLIAPPVFDSFLYSKSAHWYPAPSNVDYFTSRLKIIVPPAYSVISTGKLLERFEESGLEDVRDVEKVGQSVYVFETQHPVKYLTFIVGKFRKIAEVSNGIPVQYFRSLDVRVPILSLAAEAKSILTFYQELFGLFPYDKFCIAHRSWFQSGGHSPPSFVVLNELPRRLGTARVLDRGSPVNLSNYKEYFLAHEIAHQWWGQGVGWKTYQDQWLSEGLAQFSTILYLRKKYGEKEFLKILKNFSRWTEKKSTWGQITLGSRISFFDFKAYQAITYNKTALVLNMLKEILGEEAFFSGLQEFFRKKKYSAARGRDFFNVMSETAGLDLNTFYEMWFNSYLLPEVHLFHAIRKTDSGYDLEIQISQKNKVFVFPLYVQWEEKSNKIRKRIVVTGRVKKEVFHLKEKPRKIKFDPDRILPGKLFVETIKVDF